MDTQVRELQEKALNGDTEALDLYNEYVNKGVAPAIHVQKESISQGKMMEGYKALAKERGDITPSLQHKELTQDEIKDANPIIKMAYGYEAINAINKDKEGGK
ncbi:hypothetical protein GLV94_01930 [Virgibacillus halodenitrificans]|uniref:hypothetical protein n=1 Tax=Virgibacillus halodenitrificans TaxID=1482 RepID=UPI00136BB70E|nr:hypothetical protein [Virgibacillus halodenitrificans]MYL44393.1 hypothetical protein [Virgibacillus halodenitrificans]